MSAEHAGAFPGESSEVIVVERDESRTRQPRDHVPRETSATAPPDELPPRSCRQAATGGREAGRVARSFRSRTYGLGENLQIPAVTPDLMHICAHGAHEYRSVPPFEWVTLYLSLAGA